MTRALRLLAAAAALSAIACNFSYTATESVEVPGDAPADEKLEIAKAVATQVWEGGLVAEVGRRFPDLSEEELGGLGLRWSTTTTKSLLGEDRGTRTRVSIRCIFQQKRSIDFGRPVVDFCKAAIQEALDRHLREASPGA